MRLPMSDAAQLLLDQALELTAHERAVIAEQILLSLERPDKDLDAIWATEVESRLSAYRNGHETVIPLTEVIEKS